MPKDHWTGLDLASELRAFEAALRAAGLRENTVQTYVGRSETFVRWLTGEYTPRGPNDLIIESTPNAAHSSLATRMLDDLRFTMARDDLARYLGDYATATNYDGALREFAGAVGGSLDSLDMHDRGHLYALLDWLRAWGCRHLRVTDTARTAEVLRRWWEQAEDKLPGPETPLIALDESVLRNVEEAYDALATAQAAGRTLKDRDVEVAFGDTAAAKTLYVLRPKAFPPWDEPIRLAFGWWGGGAAYVDFLRSAASAIEGLVSRLGTSLDALPGLLGRPYSSPPKIVDEFLWIRITRGIE